MVEIMGDNRIGTLRLSGNGAIDFVKSFFYPTKEEIATRTELREEINQHINICRTERGFEAEIDDDYVQGLREIMRMDD